MQFRGKFHPHLDSYPRHHINQNQRLAKKRHLLVAFMTQGAWELQYLTMCRWLRTLWVILALLFLLEAWLWDHLEPIVARVVDLIPLGHAQSNAGAAGRPPAALG